MEKKPIALRISNGDRPYLVLPIADGKNLILDMQEDGTWKYLEGGISWETMVASYPEGLLYDVVAEEAPSEEAEENPTSILCTYHHPSLCWAYTVGKYYLVHQRAEPPGHFLVDDNYGTIGCMSADGEAMW